LFHEIYCSAELAEKTTKAFIDEYVLVSERVTFSLILGVQSLVFVVGVLTLAASVLRSTFFLLAGVNSLADVAVVVIVAPGHFHRLVRNHE